MATTPRVSQNAKVKLEEWADECQRNGDAPTTKV
jgi:hypothetical protein